MQITVPASFIADFNLVMERGDIIGADADTMRKAIRADFENSSKWVTDMANVYRFIDKTWGFMPSADLCCGYMASLGHYPEDDTVFERLGIMLLAQECMRSHACIYMTAPLRKNGVLVTTIERGCSSKVRYSDEFDARAAGQIFSAKKNIPLWLYRCGICCGWHITKKKQREDWKRVDYSYALRER